jgi:hypothetical protein
VPFAAVTGLVARAVLIGLGGEATRFYDEADYDRLGVALLDGRGFEGAHGPTAFRPPGQPLFLASVYGLFGHHPIAAAFVQAALLTVLPFAVAALARRVTSVRWVPLAAATLAAFHPGLAYASATLYPVTLAAVALTLGLWFTTVALDEGRRAHAAGGGLALGLAAAFAPYFAPLPILAAGLALGRRRIAVAALLAGLGALPTAAWMTRNHTTMGAFTLGTNGGYNLALGANDRAEPRSGNWIEPDLPAAGLPDDEVQRDAAYRAVAVAWIGEHPASWAELVVSRAALVLDSVGRPKTAGLHDNLAARLVGYAMLPWIGLGVAGLVALRRTTAGKLAALALALVVASSALTLVKPRFRFPVDGALAPFALVVVAAALRRRAPATAADPPGLVSAA